MHVDTMRFIDRWVGIPLTFLLTQGRRIYHLLKPEVSLRPKRVLFIELSEMGSTILADPAMRHLRTQLQCTLYFVIFKKNRASLDLLATVAKDNVFTIRESNPVLLLIDTLRFLAWCRRNRFDTVIDLELFSRFTALLTGLCGAVNRVGFHSFHNEGLYRGSMLTHRVMYNPHIHIAKNFMALVNSLLAPVVQKPYCKERITDADIALPLVRPQDNDLEAMRHLVQQLAKGFDPNRHRLVLINPNASELLPQRRWMPERYLALIKEILMDEDIYVLITGAPAEHGEAEQLCQAVANSRVVNFAGQVQLQKLPALYWIATAMVTNDSGPGHFSAITPLPTLVLFGPETPALYGSLGRQAKAIYAGLACSPCVSAANHRKTPCTDNKCLQAITVDMVMEALRPMLAGAVPRPQAGPTLDGERVD